MVVGLFLRAHRLCSPQNLDSELDYIKCSFLDLAYPPWFLDIALRKARKIYFENSDRNTWSKEGVKVITLPYSHKLKEVTKMLGENDYKFAFHFKNTIKKCLCINQFGNKKDTEEPGVYVIDCNNCNLSYVGETGRQLSTRLIEHSRAISKYDENSAIATHCWEYNHRMNFNDSKIIYKDKNIKRRRVVEGVLINSIPTVKGNKSFNTFDNINSSHVLREANLSEFVKVANDRVLLPVPNHPIPNPPAPNPGLTDDHQQLGRITMTNDQGQAVRRSRRIMLF